MLERDLAVHLFTSGDGVLFAIGDSNGGVLETDGLRVGYNTAVTGLLHGLIFTRRQSYIMIGISKLGSVCLLMAIET